MKQPRISIVAAMALVATVALNMAAFRALYSFDPELASGVVLTGFAQQWALWRAIRGGGAAPEFWIGFVASGLVASSAFAWWVVSLESPLSVLWAEYSRHANIYLNRTTHVWDFLNSDQETFYPLIMITLAIVWSIPQLVLAIFGGFVASAIPFRRSAGWPRPGRSRA